MIIRIAYVLWSVWDQSTSKQEDKKRKQKAFLKSKKKTENKIHGYPG